MTQMIPPPSARSGELVHRSLAELDRWQANVSEPPLEAGRRIIDAHFHFWLRPTGRYLVEEYREELRRSGHDVVGSVFVECGYALRDGWGEPYSVADETRAVREVTENSAGVAAGIVGFADLTHPDIRRILESHVAAGAGRFKGIRHRAVYDPEVRPNTPGLRPQLLLDPDFRRGFKVLADTGLSFDAWQYYTQLSELADLAGAFPQATIIANHLGGPIGIGSHALRLPQMWEMWRKGIHELAQCPNIAMKLSGLGMLHCGYDFHFLDEPPASEALADAWRTPMVECIEAFGPDRCMFASNFPTDKQSYGYDVLWNAFKRIAADYTEQERDALFLGTAKRCYRLRL